MPVPRLEPELADHLRVEFGLHGSRAVEFLESAQLVLAGTAGDWPRIGETVAYLCREALESITAAGGSDGGGRWRELSREVVKAADRYTNATQTQDEDSAQLLGELLRTIGEVSRFHGEDEGRHQKQLIAVMISRAGVPPSEGSGVIAAFQILFERLNDALHDECPVSAAREMFAECIALVRRLFMPMEMRDRELRSLAAASSPSLADVQRLLALVATPVHMAQFVRTMSTCQWLVQLDAAGVFDREHIEVWWAVAAAAQRLGPAHPEAISGLLAGLWARNREDPHRLQCIAHAARRMGRPGAPLLLEMLRRHPDNGAVVVEAMQAAMDLDASESLVTDFADLLFNETCWRHLYVPEQVSDRLVAGLDEHNARGRVEMLCYKLKAVDRYDHLLMRYRWQPWGTVTELDEPDDHERSPVLLSGLVSILCDAWAWVPIPELLESLDALPEGLRERSRAWVLSEAPEVDPEFLISEVEHSIGVGEVTGDHVALVDRAVQSAPADEFVGRWQQALGDPPSVEQIGQSMASDSVPIEWRRRASWARLLPDDVTRAWTAATQLIDARFGTYDRESLAQGPTIERFVVTSPFTEEHLGAAPPEQAAEQVSAWRAGPGDWDHGPKQLARTLQSVVQKSPDKWLSDPVGIVAKLYHPTYITAYLRGIKESVADRDVPVDPLIDVVALVDTAPWDVTPLADSPMDYEADWLATRRAGLDLIVAMAAADVQLGDRSDQAWAFIYDAATDTSSGESWAPMDPLTRAINRGCTRAFDAAVPFVASELRAGKPVRPEFIELLEFALTRVGNDGEEYRAVVARRLGWLRHALGDWTDDNIALLFGDDAPPELAQLTVDLAIHWGAPNQWLFATAPEMVRDAVLRDTEQAMDHFMVALLRDWPGYRLDDIVSFITQHHSDHPDLASNAGTRISHIVSDDDIEQRHIDTATQLWETLLDSDASSALGGFCWMHRAAALDDDRWAQLTARTIEESHSGGRWRYGAIDRAMQVPVSRSKLAVLNAIVRRPLEQWERYHIGEHIGEVLENAAELEQTVEYRRLVTALREHDILREDPEEGT